MALIACPECGKQVSTAARTCPGCGYPVAERPPVTAPPGIVSGAAEMGAPQEILLEVRPSWWNFGWHLLFFWLLIPL